MSIQRAVQRSIKTLDLALIAPQRGEVYHLRGQGYAGKSMRKYAESWTATALRAGQNVHWIDGASRINPARILDHFPPTEPAAHEHLHRLFIGRGFTVHQLASLIERLAREVSITDAPLVIVDAPIAMHLDKQVGDHEARCLMRRLMFEVKSIAENQNVAVLLITSHHAKSKRHQQLLTMVERQSSRQLVERREKGGKDARRWLTHSPSGLSGTWPNPFGPMTLTRTIERLETNKQQESSPLCELDGQPEPLSFGILFSDAFIRPCEPLKPRIATLTLLHKM